MYSYKIQGPLVIKIKNKNLAKIFERTTVLTLIKFISTNSCVMQVVLECVLGSLLCCCGILAVVGDFKDTKLTTELNSRYHHPSILSFIIFAVEQWTWTAIKETSWYSITEDQYYIQA